MDQQPEVNFDWAIANSTEEYTGGVISSPAHLLSFERQRLRNSMGGMPTDLFLMGLGPPPVPTCTYIGGYPYRSASSPWPHDAQQQPLTFVAQLTFAQSKDLFEQPIQDNLLVFAASDWPDTNDSMSIHCEWKHKDSNDEGSWQHPPSNSTWLIEPVYGCRYRTIDYSYGGQRFQRPRDFWLSVCDGTKIGGFPARLVEEPDDAEDWVCAIWNDLQLGRTSECGRYLGTIGSVRCPYDCSFPFINRPEPFRFRIDARPAHLLNWGDAGCLHIFENYKGGFGYVFRSS